ncbi:MAG: Malonyl CoA-acyl carrier protein transacylase [Chlamydiae bacterium]|nr:Malonyl CoA-acyl carrier protein transacylase [Chlamydiota bacterium]
MNDSTLALIFPGQGAQTVGMGKDFAESYPIARQTFEEADDFLKRSLSKVIFNGPTSDLTRTDQSQLAILVTSVAILRVMFQINPDLKPAVCAGLSLGEYTALILAKALDFTSCLQLVEHRGNFMSEACDAREGTMAVVMGMASDEVEQMLRDLTMPQDLWVANFNCPGQVAVSGTKKGIEVASQEALKRGAKRVVPLQVHGAFHSGLMQSAQEQLAPFIQSAPLQSPQTQLVMNVPGDFVESVEQMRQFLVDQVTQPVRWEQGIRAMSRAGVMTFVEVGPGRTLSGMNKRMGIPGKTLSIGKVEDLRNWEQEVEAWIKC